MVGLCSGGLFYCCAARSESVPQFGHHVAPQVRSDIADAQRWRGASVQAQNHIVKLRGRRLKPIVPVLCLTPTFG